MLLVQIIYQGLKHDRDPKSTRTDQDQQEPDVFIVIDSDKVGDAFASKSENDTLGNEQNHQRDVWLVVSGRFLL